MIHMNYDGNIIENNIDNVIDVAELINMIIDHIANII